MAHSAAGRVSWKTFTPLFWVLAALYALHRGWAWLQLSRPDWVSHYLDDLLCLPLLLTVTLFCLRLLFGPSVQISKAQIAFVVVYVSLLFESVLPQYMPRYTGDWLDVLCYALGGLIFYRFLNNKIQAH